MPFQIKVSVSLEFFTNEVVRVDVCISAYIHPPVDALIGKWVALLKVVVMDKRDRSLFHDDKLMTYRKHVMNFQNGESWLINVVHKSGCLHTQLLVPAVKLTQIANVMHLL